MPNNIINFALKRKSEVIFYKENTKDGVRFGVQYYIGDDIDDSKLDRVKSVCDTIAYREHYKAHLGKYPENNFRVCFEMPGRIHSVSFMDIPSANVYRVAELIAKYLKVNCSTTYTNPLVIAST